MLQQLYCHHMLPRHVACQDWGCLRLHNWDWGRLRLHNWSRRSDLLCALYGRWVPSDRYGCVYMCWANHGDCLHRLNYGVVGPWAHVGPIRDPMGSLCGTMWAGPNFFERIGKIFGVAWPIYGRCPVSDDKQTCNIGPRWAHSKANIKAIWAQRICE